MGLLLFDIDGTMFDPQVFGRLLRAEFAKILGTSEKDLWRVNSEYYAQLEKSTDLDPRELVAHVASSYGAERAPLDQVFWENDEIYKKSFYEESDDVLAELAKKNTLGIFSEGNLEFQRRKLSAAGIANYFDEEYVFIYRRKLLENAILTVPQAATIVDNKYDVVSELSNVANVVWINRESGENDPKIKTIHSLGELIKIFV